MDEILVIDASSLINFNKFYIFDKYEKGKVYSKLFNFILEKIKNEKIIIIDKAYEEISMNNYVRELKQAIKDYQKETLYLFSEVQRLIQENKRDEIIRMYSEEAVDSELEEYENKHADLYLIAYCIKLKKEGKTPILITEETLGDDKKIIEKIPAICKKENITFDKIPQVIFKIYKDKLEFDLKINSDYN